jgi:hypothetical protein
VTGTAGSGGSTGGIWGSPGAGGAAGTGGTAGAIGAGGTSGTAGATGTAGTLGTAGGGGRGGTTGVGGAVGTAGAGGTAGVAGTAGRGGSSGSAGTGGVVGTGGAIGTGGRGGSAGVAGTAGRGGSGGTTGVAGTGGSGTAGRGGTTGTGGTGGGTCVPTTIQLLMNPNFDTTPVVWTQDSGYGTDIIGPPLDVVGSQTPPYVAWEGGYDNAQDDLYQDVMVPASATSITFSFWYYIGTEETDPTAYDKMNPYVYDPTTQGLTVLDTFSNLDETTLWTKVSYQIPTVWAGRIAEFGFLTMTDNAFNTNFFIDTVSVTVTACVSSTGGGI